MNFDLAMENVISPTAPFSERYEKYKKVMSRKNPAILDNGSPIFTLTLKTPGENILHFLKGELMSKATNVEVEIVFFNGNAEVLNQVGARNRQKYIYLG